MNTGHGYIPLQVQTPIVFHHFLNQSRFSSMQTRYLQRNGVATTFAPHLTLTKRVKTLRTNANYGGATRLRFVAVASLRVYKSHLSRNAAEAHELVNLAQQRLRQCTRIIRQIYMCTRVCVCVCLCLCALAATYGGIVWPSCRCCC